MNRLFLCLLSLLTFACDNTLGPPEGILPERKMISILVDLQVAESKIKTLRVSSDSARHIFNIYEVQILDQHNVTADDYLQSYEYYLENHRLMSRVHQAVLDTLLARQTKMENMPIEEPKPEIVPPAKKQNKADTLQADTLAQQKQIADSANKRIFRKPSFKKEPPSAVLRKKERQ